MVVEQVAVVEVGGDERAQQGGAAHQLRVDLLHHLVAAEAHEDGVELLAEHVGERVVAGGHGLALALDMLAQLGPAGRPETVAQLGGDALFDKGQRVIDLHRVLHAGTGDEGAAVALDLGKAVVGKADQRLADDDAADVEDLRQLALAKLAAGHEAVIEDRPRQYVGNGLRAVAHGVLLPASAFGLLDGQPGFAPRRRRRISRVTVSISVFNRWRLSTKILTSACNFLLIDIQSCVSNEDITELGSRGSASQQGGCDEHSSPL
jgi:hypothetical protein